MNDATPWGYPSGQTGVWFPPVTYSCPPVPPTVHEEEELSAEEKKAAREQFALGAGCVHCGGLHLRACPRVRRIRWARPGEPEEVEYWETWLPPPGVIWPEDVAEEEDGE